MALNDDQILHAEVGLSLASEKFEQELDRALTDFKAKTGEIDRTTATAEVGLDLAPFRAAILEFRRDKLKLEEEKAQLGAEISKKDKLRILAEIEEVKRGLKAATREKIEFEIDLTGKQQLLAMEKALASDERSRLLASRKLEDERTRAGERYYTAQKRSIAEEADAQRRNEAFDKARYDNQRKGFIEEDRAHKENEAYDLRSISRVRESLANDGKKLDLQRQYKTTLEDVLGKQAKGGSVDLDTKRAEAKLALLRFDIERAGGTVDVKVNIDRSQLSALGNIKQDASGIASSVGGFLKRGPDILPGRGVIPLGGALAASPLLISAGASAVGLAGAVGGGALAGGAAAGGIGAGLASNVLGLARAFDVTKQETHQADQALIKYEETSRKYGATNVRTLKALAEYNNIIGAMTPAAREFSLALKGAQEEWNKFTKAPIEKDTISVLRNYSRAIKEFTPGLAANSNETGGIVSKHANSLLDRLSTGENKGDILSLGKSANKFLDPALTGAEHLIVAFVHVASAAAAIFSGPLGKGIKEIGEDLDKAAKPGDHLNQTLIKLGGYASDSFKLVTALGKLLITTFSLGAESGDNMLQKMTAALERWDGHLKTVEGRQGAQNFFKVSAESMEKLTPLILVGGKLLAAWATALIPAANLFLEILKVTTEIVDHVGKLVGLHKPLETLGAAMGAVFAASKFQAGVTATRTIMNNIKNMDGPLAALKGLFTGDLFKKQNPVVEGAKVGSDLWYERIVAAATEGGSIMARDISAGAAAGGRIAGEEEAAGTASGGLLGGGAKSLVGEGEAALGGGGSAGFLSKIIPGLLKGGLLAGGTYLASQALGSVIGGQTGKDVSKYGGQAAVGAGIGLTLAGPIGAAVGAAVTPGLVALANSINGPAATRADSLGKAAHLSSTQISELNSAEQNATQPHGRHSATVTGGGTRGTGSVTRSTPINRRERFENQAIEQNNEENQGHTAGAALAKNVLSGREFPNVDSIVRVTKASLGKLGPVGQESMLAMVKKMVETLEHEGRIVPGSVRKLLDGVQSALTGLGSLGEISGKQFSDQLARSINSHQMQTALSNFTRDMQKRWGPEFGQAISTHDSFTKVISSTHVDLEKLEYEMRHGTSRQKEVAQNEYKEMRDGIGKYIGNTRSSVESEIDYLNKTMKTRGPKGPEELAKAYQRMRETIQAEVSTGLKSVSQGVAQINRIMKAELKQLNPKNPSSVAEAGLIGQATGEAAVEIAGGGKAKGGLMQFGSAGARGMDAIPVHMMVGSGEVGAVFTHQQQQKANHYLSPIGGLPGLFNSTTQPHHMAKGGFVPDTGTNFSTGKEPQIAADLRRLGEAEGWTIHGISGYRSPAHSIAVGGFPNDPHTRGEAADIGINSSLLSSASVLTAGLLAKFGLERPFYPADPHEINHVQLLGGGAGQVLAAAGIAAGSAASAAVHQAFKKLVAPHAKGNGVIHAIAQAALNKATKAANAHLSRAIGSTGGSEGATAGKGSVSGSIVTASEFGGHNEPSAYQHKTASGAIANDSLMGFAELSNPPGSLNFSALGGLPMHTLIKVGYHGRTLTLPKVDVGAGGSGLGGHIRAIDLTYAAARALGAPGLENVSWKRAAKGGMYGAPALLVGEHQNEYVINPTRADNAQYLHQAATDMGYRVTPAAKGKPAKVPPKSVLNKTSAKELKELPYLSEAAQHHGVPLEALTPIVSDLEAALRTEKTTYHSLQNRQTKALAKLTATKAAGAHNLAEAYSTTSSSVKHARESGNLSLASSQKSIESAVRNGIPGAPNVALDNANKSKAIAERRAAQTIKTAEEAGARRIRKAEYAASTKLKAEEAALKHIRDGMHAIQSGKTWEHTKYIGLSTLEGDVREGKGAEKQIKDFDKHIKALNRQLSAVTHGMNVDASRWSHTKDTKVKAGLDTDWKGKLVQREALVKQLKDAIGGSKSAAETFSSKHKKSPHIDQVKAMLETTEAEVQDVEDKENESEGLKETGVGPAETTAAATAESFIEGLGKTEQLKELEERYALSQTALVPDNPNTTENEEVPGLKRELGPAQGLQSFWEGILSKAQEAHEPPEVITSIANSVTSARSTAFGLAQSIETAEKGVASQGLQESNAFGEARLQLYKNFGSNFSPVFQPVSPSAPAGAAPASAGGESKTVNVNVTNHFARPPADAHTWSHGVAWELEAAI